MKNFLLSTLLFILLVDMSFAQSKEYRIPDIRVDVQIMNNGVVHIDEQRTYEFEGSFSWADYRLPKRGFAEMRDIRVSEPESSYVNENTEKPGTFSVSEDDDRIIIKWYYNAEDTTRTFTVSYDLTDALSVGPDWTEFFWNDVASGREKPTENVDIHISLPKNIPADSLYGWSRGALDDRAIQKDPGSFSVTGNNIPSDESVQIRTLFPTAVFDMSSVSVTDPDLSLEWALEDEAAFREEQVAQTNRKAFYSSITPKITILIIVVSIIGFFLLFRKYGQRFSVRTVSDRETILIPDTTAPAIIGRLMSSGNTSGRHLVATLFDLARRGWFIIHEEEKEKKGFFSFTSKSNQFRISNAEYPPDEELPEWEKMIVDFVNMQIIDENDHFDKLFKSNRSKMSKWFSKWQKEVKKIFNQKNWIDRESYKGAFINVGVQVILIAASVVMMILGKPESALIGLIVSFIMAFASAAIIRRTREGEETYKRWKAYREGLKNADKRTLRMEMLDRHFIYALALNLSEKKIQTVIESVDNPDATTFSWIVLMPGSSNSPASVAASLITLAATGTSSASSVAGGAGASAGAAGGGAAGGAG